MSHDFHMKSTLFALERKNKSVLMQLYLPMFGAVSFLKACKDVLSELPVKTKYCLPHFGIDKLETSAGQVDIHVTKLTFNQFAKQVVFLDTSPIMSSIHVASLMQSQTSR